MINWAKTTTTGAPGIGVKAHCLNVADTTLEILDRFTSISRTIGIDNKIIAFFAACHDCGKHSPGFLRKCEQWLLLDNNSARDREELWHLDEVRHEKVSQFSVFNWLINNGKDKRQAAILSSIVGMHHGQLNWNGNKQRLAIAKEEANSAWEKQRQVIISELWNEIVGPDQSIINIKSIKKEEGRCLVFAGLITLADWIASDESCFPVEEGVSRKEAKALAREALNKYNFNSLEFKKGMTFSELFGFDKPNLLQEKVLEISGPKPEKGVYIIEAPMGMGKTEAAFQLAYNLIDNGSAEGIYFAMPTQATSNKIHERILGMLANMGSNCNELQLIHGSSWLMDDTKSIKPASQEEKIPSGSCIDWFNSSRRALLSPLGVGTLDQALLSVIKTKHFQLRSFALANKVVIIDEVHSYDIYTGQLLELLIDKLISIGSTPIILSATLSSTQRSKLIGEISPKQYPLITFKGHESRAKFLPFACSENKKVSILNKDLDKAIEDAIQAASKGAKVLLIQSTVAHAQETYKRLMAENWQDGPEIGLLHSRFPYSRRQELERKWLTKFGKERCENEGAILVSTQIVEQSVDLDADILISDTCPIDMFLQRIGRLWRHKRGKRPVNDPQVWKLNLDSPTNLNEANSNDIKEALGSLNYVYDPYTLLRTHKALEDRSIISIPSDIAPLIEEVYKDLDESDSWQEIKELSIEAKNSLEEKANIGSKLWRSVPTTNDQKQEAKTRYSEIKYCNILLLKEVTKQLLTTIEDGQILAIGNKPKFGDTKKLHSNTISVPAYMLKGLFKADKSLQNWRLFDTAIGIVDNNSGAISINGYETKLSYSNTMGVFYKKED